MPGGVSAVTSLVKAAVVAGEICVVKSERRKRRRDVFLIGVAPIIAEVAIFAICYAGSRKTSALRI